MEKLLQLNIDMICILTLFLSLTAALGIPFQPLPDYQEGAEQVSKMFCLSTPTFNASLKNSYIAFSCLKRIHELHVHVFLSKLKFISYTVKHFIFARTLFWRKFTRAERREIKFSAIIPHVRIIEENMANRETKVSWINHWWWPREN